MMLIRTFLILACFLPAIAMADPLSVSFQNPPEATKPWCYWYWLNGEVTKEGITKDLEAMADVGINLAMIGNVTLNKKTGPVKMMSPEWMELTRHALSEGNRLGVDIYMFNGPGWSQSGGPWIKPEQSMRRVMWKEFPTGGGNFSQKVRPDNIIPGQDIAVLAIPQREEVSIEGEAKEDSFVFSHNQPFAARSLLIEGRAKGTLFAMQGDKKIRVADIDAQPGNAKTDFLPEGMQNFSFKDTLASEFVFEIQPEKNKKKAPEVKMVLTSEPKVARVQAKQMGRMHPTPEPAWESYIFPDTVEPEDPAVLVRQDQIMDLSDKLKPDGTLTASLPLGNWTVLYFGMINTGKKNAPAPPEATGLEVDKMSREHTRHHFQGQFAGLLGQMSAEERKALTGITIDSYEVGAQNWTDGFAEEFKRRNGYDPVKLLPVFTGRVIDSAKTSDQFLWDLRRTVADMISENYVGGLREIAHENNLKLWCENYGHWGYPGDFLSYGGQADEVGGEFWTRPGNRGAIECRAASSAAHIYGKRRVYAEAYTSGLSLNDHPYSIKARGEQLFAEGIDHFVLHVYAHQPQDGIPGNNPAFGTAFHRNTPWFGESKSWVKYLQRCHLMLQQGEPASDVLVYIGDFAPQMTGPRNPVPEGYDYDYIGSDAILRTLQVIDGEWVVYDEKDPKRISARWKLLAMPKSMHMRPQVRERLEALKKQGGRVIESVKVSPQALTDAGIAPALSGASSGVRWKERQLPDGRLFFLSNFQKTGPFQATLRVSGKQPELFNPVTGEVKKLARFESKEETTSITLDVRDQADSCFLIFREAASQPSVVEASASPADLNLFFNETGQLVAESAKAGNHAIKLSNGKQHEIVFDRDGQEHEISGPWETESSEENPYSVTQKTRFNLPMELSERQRVILILGKVNLMAQVTLNGTTYDTLWMPPFELDVTDALKPGANTLEVKVTSTSTSKPTLENVQLRTQTRQVLGP